MDSVQDAACATLLQCFQGGDNLQGFFPDFSKSSDHDSTNNWNNASDLLPVHDCASLITPADHGTSSGLSLPLYQTSIDNQLPAKQFSQERAKGGHHCYLLARSTLDLLQQPHQPAGNSPLTVDHTLRNNRSATAKVLQILDCSCAHNPHLALLSAAIVSKILAWYQAIGGVALSFHQHQQPQAFDRQNNSNSNFTVSSLSSARLPISMGVFTLDGDDQGLLSQQIVLSEARRVSALVERMAALQGDLERNNDNDGGMGSLTGALYASLAVWLQSELSRTTREMNEQIRRVVGTGP